jgi:choline monooxygenase
MFIHQNRLEHLLTPVQYFSAEQHQLEMEPLLLPSWHLLATTADLPKDGDFVTLDLFGRPAARQKAARGWRITRPAIDPSWSR